MARLVVANKAKADRVSGPVRDLSGAEKPGIMAVARGVELRPGTFEPEVGIRVRKGQYPGRQLPTLDQACEESLADSGPAFVKTSVASGHVSGSRPSIW